MRRPEYESERPSRSATLSEPPVITGLGAMCALGLNLQEVTDGALKGECGIRDCRDILASEGFEMPSVVHGAAVPGPLGSSVSNAFSRSTVFAMTAGREALDSAGLLGAHELDERDVIKGIDPDRCGVVSGAAAPSADLYMSLGRSVLHDGLGVVNGRTAPALSAHAPAAVIALTHGLRGPNLAVSAACATGALVLLTAADQIRLGRADVVVAIAAESPLCAVGFTSFAQARAISDKCQPFDRNRRGLVLGEGAGAMVIESAAHARARGARVLARLLGGGLTDDAHHMWKPDVDSWARTMALALRDAGLDPHDVNYVSAHAAGTPAGDSAEVAALRKTLGPRAEEVPVWSTKGMHGHALGASGALEIVLAIQCLRSNRVPQTVGLLEPDPECDLDHVLDPQRPGRPGVVLKDSFGFGGTNCVLALDVEAA